jgi:hypothetical protein
MRWIDIARLALPILGIALPRAAPVIPIIAGAIDEAQRALPDSTESREAKREHVFRTVAAGADVASSLTDRKIDAGEAVSATQAVFQAIDAIHAIAKANQPEAAPAPAASR